MRQEQATQLGVLEQQALELQDIQAQLASTDQECAPAKVACIQNQTDSELARAKVKDLDAAVMKHGVELQLIDCEYRRLESRIAIDTKAVEKLKKERIELMKEKHLLRTKDAELAVLMEG